MGKNEYEAMDVACGPYCTFVVGRLQAKGVIEVDEPECREILAGLKKILLENQTLHHFFQRSSTGANKGAGVG